MVSVRVPSVISDLTTGKAKIFRRQLWVSRGRRVKGWREAGVVGTEASEGARGRPLRCVQEESAEEGSTPRNGHTSTRSS